MKAIINVNAFEQIVKTATRITPTTETMIYIILTNNPSNIEGLTMIYLILTNNPSNIEDTIVNTLSIGDHDIIGCNRKLNCAKYEKKF